MPSARRVAIGAFRIKLDHSQWRQETTFRMDAADKNCAQPLDVKIWMPVDVINGMPVNVIMSVLRTTPDDSTRGDGPDRDFFGHLYGLDNSRCRWFDRHQEENSEKRRNQPHAASRGLNRSDNRAMAAAFQTSGARRFGRKTPARGYGAGVGKSVQSSLQDAGAGGSIPRPAR